MIWPNGMFQIAKMTLFISRKIIAMNWVVVLILPGILAASTTPSCSTRRRRKPVTDNSRQMMIVVTHAGTTWVAVMTINAVITSNLSASGSANLPKFVTNLCLRAMRPSRLSVKVAAIKRIAAISWATGIVAPKKVTLPHPNGKTISNRKNGMMKIRTTVNLFGKFNFGSSQD